MTRKIGILPGTFDPIHDGHIGFCVEAMQKCGLDKVILLPEARPHSKPNASALATRVELIKMKLDLFENVDFMVLKSKKFTVGDTLPELLSQLKGSELTLLTGSDTAQTLHNWPRVEQLLQSVSIAVGLRGGDSQQAVDTYLQNIYRGFNLPLKYTIIQSPHPQVSSTIIREQAFA